MPHCPADSSTPAHKSPGPCLDLNGTPCQGDDIPTSGDPISHNTVSETRHGCPGHPTLDSSECQDLEIVDATKLGAVASDTIRIAASVSSSWSASGSSTPTRTSNSPIATLKTVEVPDNTGDVPLSAAPSHCSSISGTRDASHEKRLSPQTPQGPCPATTDCGSSDVGTPAHEAASRLPSGIQKASSPSHSPTKRHHSYHQAALRLTRSDSDTDGDSQGSEDLDHTNLPCHEDYCTSDLVAEGRSHEGETSDEDEQRSRKRHKVSRPPTSLMRHAAASVKRPRRGRASLRSTAQSTKGGKRSRGSGIPSPASSQATSTETELGVILARFEEWPLENVSLKRITENGKATFQFQFDWTPCTERGHAGSTDRGWVGSPSTRTVRRAKRALATRTHYTTEEDDLLLELKEGQRFVWPKIHRRFIETYPGRSVQSLQVHYSTKLKSRERS